MGSSKREMTFKEFQDMLLEKTKAFINQHEEELRNNIEKKNPQIEKKMLDAQLKSNPTIKEAKAIHKLISELEPKDKGLLRNELIEYTKEHEIKSPYEGDLQKLHEKLIPIIDANIGKIVSESQNPKIRRQERRTEVVNQASSLRTGNTHQNPIISLPGKQIPSPINGAIPPTERPVANSTSQQLKQQLDRQRNKPNLEKLKKEIKTKLENSERKLISDEKIKDFEQLNSLDGIKEFHKELQEDAKDAMYWQKEFFGLCEEIKTEIGSYETNTQTYVPSSDKSIFSWDAFYGAINDFCNKILSCLGYGNQPDNRKTNQPKN